MNERVTIFDDLDNVLYRVRARDRYIYYATSNAAPSTGPIFATKRQPRIRPFLVWDAGSEKDGVRRSEEQRSRLFRDLVNQVISFFCVLYVASESWLEEQQQAWACGGR